MTLGERIRMLRMQAGMTQDELAAKLGYISRSTIAKIEKGNVDLSHSKLVAFAAALHTTPSYLMGWDGEQTIYTAHTGGTVPPEPPADSGIKETLARWLADAQDELASQRESADSLEKGPARNRALLLESYLNGWLEALEHVLGLFGEGRTG
ncbi:MAG: helix-turn-helix domain-containing protein [Clostridiales Family XIII bacterium]|jgi:transcriptional regulator with XRE-family HTH domain|nr:helix-turn-helix domain-containing protein [Clostridiales Family XIII bacterium]